MHRGAEKSFEIDPESKDHVCPQTILQMGKVEAQRSETPEPKAETRAKVSPLEVGVQVRVLSRWAKSLRELGPKPGTNGADWGFESAWDAGPIAASVSPALPLVGDGRRRNWPRARLPRHSDCPQTLSAPPQA